MQWKQASLCKVSSLFLEHETARIVRLQVYIICPLPCCYSEWIRPYHKAIPSSAGQKLQSLPLYSTMPVLPLIYNTIPHSQDSPRGITRIKAPQIMFVLTVLASWNLGTSRPGYETLWWRHTFCIETSDGEETWEERRQAGRSSSQGSIPENELPVSGQLSAAACS